MPWGSVRVDGPPGRDVYVNGNYGEAGGCTGEVFAVEYGINSFETLDPQYRVDFGGDAEVDAAHRHVEIVLTPVFPPRRTSLTRDDAGPAEWS